MHVTLQHLTNVVVTAGTFGMPLLAAAQISGDIVKIGFITDISGLYSDIDGQGGVEAIKTAIADFGGTVNGKKIELVYADHQNKADVAASKAREWIDQQGVDVFIGGTNSGAALAMNKIAMEKKRPIVVVSAGASRSTNEDCTPYTVHYSYDTVALSKSAGTDDADKVMASLRSLKINDVFAKGAYVRADGRMIHEMYLMQVKKPAESKYPWNYYKVVARVPGEKAFTDKADAKCALWR